MTISRLLVYGGTSPWLTMMVEWEGTSVTWTLKDQDTGVDLYVGPDKLVELPVAPATLYRLRLSGDASGPEDAHYISSPLVTPSKLAHNGETDTTVNLTWAGVLGATSYEIADVHDSYEVIATTTEPGVTLTDLEPMDTRIVAVRSVLGGSKSLWSSPVVFTTLRPTTRGYEAVGSMPMEFEPNQAVTWGTIGGWRRENDPLAHGSGDDFNDEHGINTTYFLYDDTVRSRFAELVGYRITKFEVYLRRFRDIGDPRVVLSHWFLHSHASKPTTPMTLSDGADAGALSLGESDWVALPLGWARLLVNGTARGLAWGGVVDRYILVPNLSDPARPLNGTLRIAVA